MAVTHRTATPGPSASGPVVLVVALPDSIHTARWLNMARGRGIRFVLLPTYAGPVCAELRDTRPVRERSDLDGLTDREVGVFDVASVDPDQVAALDRQLGYEPWFPAWMTTPLTRPAHVAAAVERLSPALVHSMEVQFAGYLCLAAKLHLDRRFPPWLLSNWGSDIYLYRKLEEHLPRLKRIATLADAYTAECGRDIGLIRQLGFRGMVLPTLPASGGMDFDGFPPLSDLPPPSRRREILVKGYHGWSGRALHILGAIHLAAPALRNFTIRVILAGPEVRAMATTVAQWDELTVTFDAYRPDMTHHELLMRLGQARMVIGLGISDGISTTLLEAMAVGTYPIQGTGSCGCEWIDPGRTGSLVSPHDTAALAAEIERAARDDVLVDAAAPVNRRVVERRWNAAVNGRIAVEGYRAILGGAR